MYARLWAHQSGGFLGEAVDEADDEEPPPDAADRAGRPVNYRPERDTLTEGSP